MMWLEKNAHHLRELKALEEIEPESWAFSMRKLLTLANKYRHRYRETIPQPIVIRRMYAHQDTKPQSSGYSDTSFIWLASCLLLNYLARELP